MSNDVSDNGKVYVSPYFTESVVKKLVTDVNGRIVKMSLEMQAKQRDDESKTKSYPIIKFNLGGRRDYFLHIDVAEAIMDGLVELIPEGKLIQEKSKKDVQENRERYNRNRSGSSNRPTRDGFANTPRVVGRVSNSRATKGKESE